MATALRKEWIYDTKLIPFPIPVDTWKKRTRKPRGTCKASHQEVVSSHKADAFTDEKDINKIVRYLLDKGDYHKAVMFVVGINTGYRAGDLISLKVSDVVDGNGEIVEYLLISETKTGKTRKVYFNEAIRTALRFLIDKKNLKPTNFLFTGDGNRKAYFKGFEYDDNGEVINVVTVGEKFDENGKEREAAPMLVSSIGRWLVRLSKDLGIEGHFSSHAMRKTFTNFISLESGNKLPRHNVLMAQAALAHFSLDTTMDFYMSEDPRELRKKWLSLNLGLSALQDFMNDNKTEQKYCFRYWED